MIKIRDNSDKKKQITVTVTYKYRYFALYTERNNNMIQLKIRGKYKGGISIDEASSVQTLINEICSASGMQANEFKLIVGGKNLTDVTKTLQEYGVNNNKIVMVVTSQHNKEIQNMERVKQNRSHVEKIVDTAGKLASRSRLNQDNEEIEDRRSNFIFDLTDQHGNPVHIPSKDQDALMQGIMLHEKGRQILYRRAMKHKLMEKDMKEALAFFREAEYHFRQTDPKYLNLIDNYAYVCLDIVWCLFCLQDLKNLPLAEQLLHIAESGFIKSHGPNLERLFQVKGLYCAERALYVRLHLLQGVMAFAQGNVGVASQALLRARQECAALKVDPRVAQTLLENRAQLGRPVTPAAAVRALRASQGVLEHAEIFLEERWQNAERLRKEKEAQKAQRALGKTANGSWVDASLVDALTGSGFEKHAVLNCLKKTNNNQEQALMMLTLGDCPTMTDIPEEAIVTLVSLGLEEHSARQFLAECGGDVEKVIQSRLGGDQADAHSSAETGMEEEKKSAQKSSTEEGDKKDFSGTDEEKQEQKTEETDCTLTKQPTKMQGCDDFDKDAAQEIAEGLNVDDEAYLDISLIDEGQAIELYLKMCSGTIPAHFNIDDILRKCQSQA